MSATRYERPEKEDRDDFATISVSDLLFEMEDVLSQTIDARRGLDFACAALKERRPVDPIVACQIAAICVELQSQAHRLKDMSGTVRSRCSSDSAFGFGYAPDRSRFQDGA